MKKITLFVLFLILAASCGVKQTQTMLSDGNYDGAINKAVENLRTNKTAKSKQSYIYLLEEAFAKAKERNLNTVNLMMKDNNPAQLEKIFTTYMQLHERQEKIKPVLPLSLIKEGRNAIFPFDNYNNQIVSSKNALSNYLYNNTKALMLTNNKMNYRRAFDDLSYLNQINPGYKDILKLMEEAHFKGTDFVHVYTKNETNMIIPVRLQNDLLDFSTYGLNDKWTVYHSNKQLKVNYDFGLLINFREINISPEQIKEKEFDKERLIKDGQKKRLDANGKVVLDEKGREIMEDNMKTVRIHIYEIRQFKACQVAAKIDYVDFKSNQLLQTFPLASEYVFENIYSTYQGDQRACDDNYIYFNKRAVPFPNSEQMVYDSGENLKAKIKNIISRNSFRN
jgi:hypothetical protein